MIDEPITRRGALGAMAAGAAGAALTGVASAANDGAAKLKGRIKQSVSRWCFSKVPWDEFCKACKEMGIVGVDLVGAGDIPHLKKYGLVPTMYSGIGGIKHGFNRRENHAKFLELAKTRIPEAKKNGAPNVITMSGERMGQDDEEGLDICAEGLKDVVKIAEDNEITLCIELLNSKVNHKDYQCDHTAWAVELIKRIDSPRFKALYDIYHMQIMEGDIIRTIKDNIQYIGHFHTGGNPGRNEIDETQELNYAAIMKAIAETDYEGYVAHEFVPKRKDKLASLRQAVEICDV